MSGGDHDRSVSSAPRDGARRWRWQVGAGHNTWRFGHAKRNVLWRKYKNVTVKDFPRHKELQGFIQARKSISHGLGSLTRRQLRNRAETAKELGDAGIDLRGDSVVIDASHVEACAEIVKAFVLWLDTRC
jgi:hypothetical protein